MLIDRLVSAGCSYLLKEWRHFFIDFPVYRSVSLTKASTEGSLHLSLMVTTAPLHITSLATRLVCAHFIFLAPAVTVGERRELWILPPFFFGLFFCL